MTVDLLAVLGTGVVDPATPVLCADDAGVTRGDGCFEGCRLVDGTVADLDAHLDRMARSAASLEITFDRAAWTGLVAEAVAAWTLPDEAAVKLVLTRGPADAGPTAFVTVGPLPADAARLRRDGGTVITLTRGYPADAFADAPWLLGGVKTLSYAVNMAAAREAARRGADDVLFTSADGRVLEAPTATAVWAVGRALHTVPTGATGILGSITQQHLFAEAAAQGWGIHETPATVEDLHAADALWLVSSVRGPVEVVDLDGTVRERRPDLDGPLRALAGF